MSKKKIYFTFLIIISSVTLIIVNWQTIQSIFLNNKTIIEPELPFGPSDDDDPKRDSIKKAFFDKLYYATENTNVDSIRQYNWEYFIRKKNEMKQNVATRNGGENFANGNLTAKWHERGPINEAGDMRHIDYLPTTNMLYGISRGGHLWKGSLNGSDWTLLNDDIRFVYNRSVIKVLPQGNGSRIFAIYGDGVDNKIIRYSDDEGQSWTVGTGFVFYDHWGGARRLYALSDNTTLFYLVQTWSGSPWGKMYQLYKSTDKGATYTKVWDSGIGADNETVDLWKPHDSDNLFLIDNFNNEFIRINHDIPTNNTTFNSVSFSDQNIVYGGIHVSGRFNSTLNDYEFFICHDDNDKIYKTVNGSNWTYLSTASDNIWNKGWLANPNNNDLYVGSFQLNKTNNGINWQEQYSDWWRYYDTSKDSMHVDIMNLNYFEKTDGTPFIIVCNHAGVHVTYDNFSTTQNLGLTSLNIVTLYDQTTAQDGFLYCGAQDKGTFIFDGNTKTDFTPISTQNTNTGDGMLGVFSNSDQSYFGMIQNGRIYAFPNRSSSQKYAYTIPGNHKSGWINPIVSTPNFIDNKIYVAGGNLNGGNGCYLIEMNPSNVGGFSFNPTQFNYDFRANSNSGTAVIKAIGVSTTDENRLYVATEDGTFFRSTNQGQNWIKSNTNLPNAFIPWEIITAKNDEDLVFISGTGFSNHGVFQSTDGGQNFSALSNGIPSATFYEVTLSDDNSMLFAATSEGPFVYVFDDALWYDLIGSNSPYVDYTSVDNIGNNIIRFGTYGRGIFDFEIITPTPLVTVVAFDANLATDSTVLTSWETTIEYNTVNFEVEYSIDTLTFTSLTTIVSQGNSTVPQLYDFVHNSPIVGKNYYRLKTNNLDGTTFYSPNKIIEIEPIEEPEPSYNEFQIYPQPLPYNTPLTIEIPDGEVIDLTIYNAAGQLILQKNNLSGLQTLTLNITSGVYFYDMHRDDERIKSGKLLVY